MTEPFLRSGWGWGRQLGGRWDRGPRGAPLRGRGKPGTPGEGAPGTGHPPRHRHQPGKRSQREAAPAPSTSPARLRVPGQRWGLSPAGGSPTPGGSGVSAGAPRPIPSPSPSGSMPPGPLTPSPRPPGQPPPVLLLLAHVDGAVRLRVRGALLAQPLHPGRAAPRGWGWWRRGGLGSALPGPARLVPALLGGPTRVPEPFRPRRPGAGIAPSGSPGACRARGGSSPALCLSHPRLCLALLPARPQPPG